MKKYEEFQKLLLEIETTYEKFSVDPNKVFEKKGTLLKKIQKLRLPNYQKECLGSMLLACINAFNKVSNCNKVLSKSAYAEVKAKTIEAVLELHELIKKINNEETTGLTVAHCS